MIPEDATTTKEVSTDKETKMIDLTGSWTLVSRYMIFLVAPNQS
jgi:hypothetical protein